MKYKIRDTQFGCRYFSNGELFDSLEDIRLQLCSFHSVDWSGEEEEGGKERDINDLTLTEILDYGEWSIEDEDGNEINII